MPRSVPWSFVETFRVQAERNHDQTLERLARRGGLSPEEMYAAAHGLGIIAMWSGNVYEQMAIDWLVEATKGGE